MRSIKTWAKRAILGSSLALVIGGSLSAAQMPAAMAENSLDSDHDGLTDQLEQRLLLQFMPIFMTGTPDCSTAPAEFKVDSPAPVVLANNGTIYGQASPSHSAHQGPLAVELRYYHLWQRDCGAHGHPLDAEHFSVLIEASDPNRESAHWKATYWYAAAHENTVCDVSQIAPASTLKAEDHGAKVWISPGKHASYLAGALCGTGCGADHCDSMTEFVPSQILNLGEPGFPMNGSSFISSKAWSLESKMTASDFPAEAVARLNEMPEDEVALFNPGRHPVQGIIATSSRTELSLARSGASTTAAIGSARSSTGDALSGASGSTGAALSAASADTGNALQNGYKHTQHAVGTSIRHIGSALHLSRQQDNQRR